MKLETYYDPTRKIGRIELFEDNECIASRVVYTVIELKSRLKDFAPIMGLTFDAKEAIVRFYAESGLPDGSNRK